MNNQQVQQLEETAQQVHGSLANMFASLRIARPDFAELPYAQKVELEKEWLRVHRKAIWDLSMSLNLFELRR